MSALEEFEIYKASRTHKNLVLNDQLSFNSNSLYDTALQHVYQIMDKWEINSCDYEPEQCALILRAVRYLYSVFLMMLV